jgi:hypothetical protein
VRSPGPSFDIRSALTAEMRAAHTLTRSPLTAQAVHAGRLHLKRARALAEAGGAGAPGLAAVFDEAARGALHALAPVRELAALAETARRSARRAGRKSALALHAAAERLDNACAALLAGFDHAALAGVVQDLLALAQVWPEASPRQIARGADALIRRARRARRRALSSDEPAVRHAWRRREKARLYAAQALARAWPSRRKRAASAKLCHALGQERDTLLLIERLSANPIAANDDPTSDDTLDVLRARARRWRKRANKLGRRLRRARA